MWKCRFHRTASLFETSNPRRLYDNAFCHQEFFLNPDLAIQLDHLHHFEVLLDGSIGEILQKAILDCHCGQHLLDRSILYRSILSRRILIMITHRAGKRKCKLCI